MSACELKRSARTARTTRLDRSGFGQVKTFGPSEGDYAGRPVPSRPCPNGRVAIPPAPPPKRHPYDQWSPDARALDLVGDKWTLLIVRDLVSGPRRFVELQRVLPGISTEQLRSRLNRMVADGLLTRQRYREVPPRVDYELTERARDLIPVLGALARWGYEWTWSSPRSGEDDQRRRDLPPRARAAHAVRGRQWRRRPVVSAEGEDPELRFRLSASGGEAAISERSFDGRADATVTGGRARTGCARSARRARSMRCRCAGTARSPTSCSARSCAPLSIARRPRRGLEFGPS